MPQSSALTRAGELLSLEERKAALIRLIEDELKVGSGGKYSLEEYLAKINNDPDNVFVPENFICPRPYITQLEENDRLLTLYTQEREKAQVKVTDVYVEVGNKRMTRQQQDLVDSLCRRVAHFHERVHFFNKKMIKQRELVLVRDMDAFKTNMQNNVRELNAVILKINKITAEIMLSELGETVPETPCTQCASDSL